MGDRKNSRMKIIKQQSGRLDDLFWMRSSDVKASSRKDEPEEDAGCAASRDVADRSEEISDEQEREEEEDGVERQRLPQRQRV